MGGGEVTRDELTAALEKASKPSRELDGYIYMLTLPASRRRPVSWEVTPEGMIWAWTQNPPHAPGTGGWWATPPEYTASIDAALTLVPGEAFWNVLTDGLQPTTRFQAADATDAMADVGRGLEWHAAATPAIAICIAALAAIRASAVEVVE